MESTAMGTNLRHDFYSFSHCHGQKPKFSSDYNGVAIDQSQTREFFLLTPRLSNWEASAAEEEGSKEDSLIEG